MAASDPTDPHAFTDLVRGHQASLRAFVRSLGVEPEWVDDVTQESFLVAYERMESFDTDREFARWIRGIARHLVMNERRKQARQARILHGPLTDFLALRRRTETQEDRELIQTLRGCLDRLPERSRRLLRWRYESEQKSGELAQRLHTTADAVRQQLLRVRLAVKNCVEKELGSAWA